MEKDFAYLLGSLAIIAASLFSVFTILTTTRLSIAMGLTFFVMVTILLILGYALGVVALAFLGILVLTRIRRGKEKHPQEQYRRIADSPDFKIDNETRMLVCIRT